MKAVPFRDLHPARDLEHVQWVAEAMRDAEGIANVIPSGFDAYLRLHHPLSDGNRWSDVAPSYLRRGKSRYEYPFPQALDRVVGNLAPAAVDAVTAVLAALTSTPEKCHYGLWGGWGELNARSSGADIFLRATSSRLGQLRNRYVLRRLRRQEARRSRPTYDFVESCPVQPWWGARDTLMFDGPVEAVRFVAGPSPFFEELNRRSPQWWWPSDRAWFVANEIDYPWTYVGGSTELIERVRGIADLETVDIEIEDEW